MIPNLRSYDIQISDGTAGNRTVDQLHLVRVPSPATDIPHLVTGPRITKIEEATMFS